MELKIKLPELPKIESSNFQELKNEVGEKLTKYTGLHYDENNIDEAKSDRAELNNLSKSIDDERKKLEKLWNKNFISLKTDINSLIKDIKTVSSDIDVQVKRYESDQKEIKKSHIQSLFINELSKFNYMLSLQQIWDEKWLNKSKSDKAIISEIQTHLLNIENDIKTIKVLNSDFEPKLIDTYLETLDLTYTIEYKNLLEKAKSDVVEIEQVKVDDVLVEDSPVNEYVVSIKCTDSQLKLLKEFMERINVSFLI